MIKIKQRKYLFFLFTMLVYLYYTVESPADNNMLQWSIADRLPIDSGISVLRYSTTGLGAYPYSYALPGTGVRVTIDGIPMRSFSPFGTDLELIPSQFVDSFEYNGLDELNINTKDVTEEEPLTSTDFLLGSRRRFNFDMTFNRKLGNKAGIFIGGSSSGIHGSNTTEKNSLRIYYIKYQRYLENKSTVNFSIYGFRDRDGIVDFDTIYYQNNHKTGTRMGERKTDNYSVSLGLNKYPIGEQTIISPVVYYQSGNSRFHRYHLRKSLDEKSAGINIFLSRKREDDTYSLHALYDTRFFDSRLHSDINKSWTRHEGEISASFMREKERLRLFLKGGVMNSSEYGAGIKFESEFDLMVNTEHEIVLRGITSDKFPDTGQEYYTSLVFSDTTTVSDLDKYNISRIETGVRFKKKYFNLWLFAFRSFSKIPAFSISQGSISSLRKLYGYRIYFDTHIEKQFIYDVTMNISQRSGKDEIWPYPLFEFFSDIRVSGNFLNNVLKPTLFANARFLRWDESEITPKGNHFMLDCGIAIKVSSLELFYKVENIINEDIEWFNTMGWLGRNGMWGGKWVFYD
ncbi:hypothetical protein ACFL4V_01685 [Candidatus Latescibacterota bacterium]